MASIRWINTSAIASPSSMPGVSLNTKNLFLSAYASTSYPQPYYRPGAILTDFPLGNDDGVIYMQDKPTNGPESFGTNPSLSMTDSGQFLAVSQKALPNGQLNYAGGICTNTGVTFQPTQVLTIPTELANPAVAMVDDNRAFVAGTDFELLGGARNVSVVPLSRNGSIWSPTDVPLYIGNGVEVQLGINASKLAVLLYQADSVGNAFRLKTGDVSNPTSAGTWSNDIAFAANTAGLSELALAVNNAGLIVLVGQLGAVMAYWIGQVTGPGQITWLVQQVPIPPALWAGTDAPNLTTAIGAAVSLNEQFVLTVITTQSPSNGQNRINYIHGVLQP